MDLSQSIDRDEDESDVDEKPKIFKEKKSNFNSKPPEALNTFFRATKSEIMDPGNRN